MNCLCCGKPLMTEDKSSVWHRSCIRHFFGTTSIPEIEIDDDMLECLASESINKGYTIPGVQRKLSLHLSAEGGKYRLTLVNYPTGYILKPQVTNFTALPEAEQLVMSMADAVGIVTVPHALVRGNGSLAYITKRIDRVFVKKDVKLLAMEDFCQLDLRLTQDKYKGSYERCAKIIDRYSSRRGLDLTELYMRLVFSYLVGNSDMHMKNVSLIEAEEGSGKYMLSPAYDLLPVNVVMPEDQEQLALALNGKKRNLHKNDFFIFADECDISRSAAEKMIHKLVSMKQTMISMCNESLLPEELKERMIALIENRCSQI